MAGIEPLAILQDISEKVNIESSGGDEEDHWYNCMEADNLLEEKIMQVTGLGAWMTEKLAILERYKEASPFTEEELK